MIKLPKLAVYALMTPALTLGMGSALASDTPAELAGAKEQRQVPGQAQNEAGMAAADRARQQRMAAVRAKDAQTDGIYLSRAPANAFSANDLIGAELKSQADDEILGKISALIVDEDGQIAALVVAVGDFLGLGEKDIAVSWDAIKRSSNEAGDGDDLSVETSREALEKAPAYAATTTQY
jgi:hypothetical protein